MAQYPRFPGSIPERLRALGRALAAGEPAPIAGVLGAAQILVVEAAAEIERLEEELRQAGERDYEQDAEISRRNWRLGELEDDVHEKDRELYQLRYELEDAQRQLEQARRDVSALESRLSRAEGGYGRW